jgi:hypothetical protein
MSDAEGAASRESKAEAAKSEAEFVRSWMDAIELSSSEEEKWRKRATEAVQIYRSGDKSGEQRDRTFNILYSNIETTIPAIYNSVPIPDVRRRFSDDDPVGKEVSDIIERSISYSTDSYDFDCVMRAVVQDMELPGRGNSRIRWKPYLDEAGEAKVYEEATCEHVQWHNFRRGPGKTWADVPWVAFELFLGREELNKLDPKVGPTINLDCNVEGVKDKNDGGNVKEIFKRARVWEIWDKDSGKVIFIAESKKDAPIRVEDDPLGLTGFFPMPRPVYGLETSNSLVPVVPYDMYRAQAEELETISERIIALTSALKARGAYDGRMAEIGRLANADDNDLVAIENAMLAAEGGGLEKAIFWFPIETISKVLEKLYLQRDQTKQTIYEQTGIADILRGATDPNETLGAQKIKSEWGSLRIQRKQMEVQRYARDLFRLKAELIATKFDWQTINLMTGLKYPTEQEKQAAQQRLQQMAMQAQQTGQQPPPPPKELQEMLAKPSLEQVDQVLRNDTMRGFRIDVESDSTIRADMTRNQQMMTQFLEGTAAFMSAVGPAVVQGFFPADVAVEVYTAFSRNFRLGKQAEDALDRLADQAKKAADQPQKKDPKLEAEEMKAANEREKHQLDMQAKEKELAGKMQLMDKQMEIKERELQLKERELMMREREMGLEMQMKEREMAMNAQAMEHKAALDQRTSDLQAESIEHKHAVGMEMMDHKAKMAKQAKPKKDARA